MNWSTAFLRKYKMSSLVSFSLTSEATEQSLISSDKDMQRIWRGASGRCITLWCNTKKVGGLTKQGYSGWFSHITSTVTIPTFCLILLRSS